MAKDPYKYYRIEARELLEGLMQSVLEFERGERGKELVARVLRLAHTLKGASRVVKQPGIADLAHLIEDAFAPLRDQGGELPPERIDQILGILDTIGSKVASLEPANVLDKTEVSPPASEEFFETVRVDIEEIDALLDGMAEASAGLAALRRASQATGRARELARLLYEVLGPAARIENNGTGSLGASVKARALADELRGHLEGLGHRLGPGIEEVEAEFAQVLDAASRLRLLSAATVFPLLQRAVRDAAQSLGRSVLFEPSGGEIRLDAHVLAALRDPLLHVVRNAVAHGIEPETERRTTGKPAEGRVELLVERRGNRVAFICRDDGRGVDVEAVRQAAVRRGLVGASDTTSLSLQQAVRVLMKGGVSTTASVDEVSGRGIGLDVVRETVARLKGEVSVQSEAGSGTSLEICVPVSLSSLPALEVEAGGTVACIPLDAVRRTLRLRAGDIARSAGRDSIVCDGRALPFLPLITALGNRFSEQQLRSCSVLVLETSGGTAAIGVDRLLGAKSVVVRPLPAFAAADPIVAGLSQDREGNPQLVLDPERLVTLACAGTASRPDATPVKRPSVLVIDDSLTTRMLEQNILESAGYEVDLATSGEEALRKALEKRYGLFLVDVEMPGMDGFEFVSHTIADPVLGKVPSILVTSRSAAEDRQRGEQVGARAYILKGEFDQGLLLERIRECIG